MVAPNVVLTQGSNYHRPNVQMCAIIKRAFAKPSLSKEVQPLYVWTSIMLNPAEAMHEPAQGCHLWHAFLAKPARRNSEISISIAERAMQRL